MELSQKKPANHSEAAVVITDLLAYRLHKVANLVSRSAAMRYKREFDVLLWEWRTIALLGAAGAMSLSELAKASGIDKGQLSRVASGLTARGLVLRTIDEVDNRKISLSLTAAGRKMYKGLNKVSNERNNQFVGCLTESERKSLAGILDKLEKKALELIAQERAANS